jgi:hypothetical protein
MTESQTHAYLRAEGLDEDEVEDRLDREADDWLQRQRDEQYNNLGDTE